jgi:hypothetical protein
LKGFGRNQAWSNSTTIPVFPWRNWRKPRKSSVGSSGVQTEVLTEHLSNISTSVTTKPYCSAKKLLIF